MPSNSDNNSNNKSNTHIWNLLLHVSLIVISITYICIHMNKLFLFFTIPQYIFIIFTFLISLLLYVYLLVDYSHGLKFIFRELIINNLLFKLPLTLLIVLIIKINSSPTNSHLYVYAQLLLVQIYLIDVIYNIKVRMINILKYKSILKSNYSYYINNSYYSYIVVNAFIITYTAIGFAFIYGGVMETNKITATDLDIKKILNIINDNATEILTNYFISGVVGILVGSI